MYYFLVSAFPQLCHRACYLNLNQKCSKDRLQNDCQRLLINYIFSFPSFLLLALFLYHLHFFHLRVEIAHALQEKKVVMFRSLGQGQNPVGLLVVPCEDWPQFDRPQNPGVGKTSEGFGWLYHNGILEYEEQTSSTNSIIQRLHALLDKLFYSSKPPLAQR